MTTEYRAMVGRFGTDGFEEIAFMKLTADQAIDLIIKYKEAEPTTVPAEFAFAVVEDKPEDATTPETTEKPKRKTRGPGRKARPHYDREAVEADIRADLPNKDIAQKHNVPIQAIYKIKHQMKKAKPEPETVEEPTTTDDQPFYYKQVQDLREKGYSAEAVREKLRDYATYNQITEALDWVDMKF